MLKNIIKNLYSDVLYLMIKTKIFFANLYSQDLDTPKDYDAPQWQNSQKVKLKKETHVNYTLVPYVQESDDVLQKQLIRKKRREKKEGHKKTHADYTLVPYVQESDDILQKQLIREKRRAKKEDHKKTHADYTLVPYVQESDDLTFAQTPQIGSKKKISLHIKSISFFFIFSLSMLILQLIFQLQQCALCKDARLDDTLHISPEERNAVCITFQNTLDSMFPLVKYSYESNYNFDKTDQASAYSLIGYFTHNRIALFSVVHCGVLNKVREGVYESLIRATIEKLSCMFLIEKSNAQDSDQYINCLTQIDSPISTINCFRTDGICSSASYSNLALYNNISIASAKERGLDSSFCKSMIGTVIDKCIVDPVFQHIFCCKHVEKW